MAGAIRLSGQRGVMIKCPAHQTFTCQPLAGEMIMTNWAGGRAESDAVNQAKIAAGRGRMPVQARTDKNK
jgi:hypothetical protein